MDKLSDWRPRRRPDGRPLEGSRVRLERLEPARHGAALGQELSGPGTPPLYDFLFEPPPVGPAEVEEWVARASAMTDPFYYAVVDRASNRTLGRLALMRIEPAHGVIEIGSILFGPRLQRTLGATEAVFLIARHVFEDLDYRRLEWKCNALNAPSMRAAARFGFTFEGIFRRHMVVKGRNRDTAWFAMLDSDWPRLRRAYEAWLDPSNFDADGQQRQGLGALTTAALRDGGEKA